MSRGQAVY